MSQLYYSRAGCRPSSQVLFGETNVTIRPLVYLEKEIKEFIEHSL